MPTERKIYQESTNQFFQIIKENSRYCMSVVSVEVCSENVAVHIKYNYVSWLLSFFIVIAAYLSGFNKETGKDVYTSLS